jgi:hypothetical protein
LNVTGNVNSGNVNTPGQISATGNITGSVITATGPFLVIPGSATDPASPVQGAIYFNTNGGGRFKGWTGSAWVFLN